MSVGQENSIQRRGGNPKRPPVPVSQLPFLVKTAINQKPGVIGLQKIAGTGNIKDPTEKTKLNRQLYISKRSVTT
jgi:hypothetical protein